jgi:hypothetical protein
MDYSRTMCDIFQNYICHVQIPTRKLRLSNSNIMYVMICYVYCWHIPFMEVPPFPCFLDSNTTSIVQYKSLSTLHAEAGLWLRAGLSRRGSHVYEINTWLCNFGRPQPRVARISVAKTERIRWQSRPENFQRAWETVQASKCAVDKCIAGIYLSYKTSE